MTIPTVRPEEMMIIEEEGEKGEEYFLPSLEDAKKKERRRKKPEKEYIFNSVDIEELNRRLANGEDLDDVTKSISEKGILSQPIHAQTIESIPDYLTERTKKKAKREEKKIARPDDEKMKIVGEEEEEEGEYSFLPSLEDINKEQRRRKKLEKEYVFNAEDIKELNRRLANGEDLDEVTKDISEKGILSPPTPVQPIKSIPLIKPSVQPVQQSIQSQIQSTESIPDYLAERARKKAKREEKKIIRSGAQRIDYPVGECCSNVCDTVNNELAQYLGLISPTKDEKLAFDALGELRRQFYLRGTCQCANGHYAQSSDIPLLKKQPENCCPEVCETLNSTIDEYEGILLPTHNTRIISETLHNIRAKMYNSNACKCVETEEQLKKQKRSGPGIDPILQNRLTQLLKYAEKQGWVK